MLPEPTVSHLSYVRTGGAYHHDAVVDEGAVRDVEVGTGRRGNGREQEEGVDGDGAAVLYSKVRIRRWFKVYPRRGPDQLRLTLCTVAAVASVTLRSVQASAGDSRG